MVMKATTYTFARKILSSVVRKTKFVSKIYKKVLISISEKRMPMHDCSEKHKRIRYIVGGINFRTLGPDENVNVLENRPGNADTASGRRSHLSGLHFKKKKLSEYVNNLLD